MLIHMEGGRPSPPPYWRLCPVEGMALLGSFLFSELTMNFGEEGTRQEELTSQVTHMT